MVSTAISTPQAKTHEAQNIQLKSTTIALTCLEEIFHLTPSHVFVIMFPVSTCSTFLVELKNNFHMRVLFSATNMKSIYFKHFTSAPC